MTRLAGEDVTIPAHLNLPVIVVLRQNEPMT